MAASRLAWGCAADGDAERNARLLTRRALQRHQISGHIVCTILPEVPLLDGRWRCRKFLMLVSASCSCTAGDRSRSTLAGMAVALLDILLCCYETGRVVSCNILLAGMSNDVKSAVLRV